MKINSFLAQLCEHCGISSDEVTITIDESDDLLSIQFELDQDDSGLFIGTHGETLDSLQRLVRILFVEEYADKKIVLNINNYREQRTDKLTDLTHSIAERVLQTGRSYTFRSFMPAYERFIVHSIISENEDFNSLESISEGEGAYRRLTIQKKQS